MYACMYASMLLQKVPGEIRWQNLWQRSRTGQSRLDADWLVKPEEFQEILADGHGPFGLFQQIHQISASYCGMAMATHLPAKLVVLSVVIFQHQFLPYCCGQTAPESCQLLMSSEFECAEQKLFIAAVGLPMYGSVSGMCPVAMSAIIQLSTVMHIQVSTWMIQFKVSPLYLMAQGNGAL